MRKIRVSLGRTINTGNYESLKVGVEYEMDIPDKADAVEAMDRGYDLVNEQLETMVDAKLEELTASSTNRRRQRRSNR